MGSDVVFGQFLADQRITEGEISVMVDRSSVEFSFLCLEAFHEN
jgi:hypothetical protein